MEWSKWCRRSLSEWVEGKMLESGRHWQCEELDWIRKFEDSRGEMDIEIIRYNDWIDKNWLVIKKVRDVSTVCGEVDI